MDQLNLNIHFAIDNGCYSDNFMVAIVTKFSRQ